MGQKVHPIGIRLGIVKDWSSKWYADSKTFSKYVFLDHKISVYIKEKLKDASVSAINIERPAAKANITIMTARPGIVIGKKGEDIEKLRKNEKYVWRYIPKVTKKVYMCKNVQKKL